MDRVKFTTTLPAVTVAWLRLMGHGNASRGIQGLVEQELEKHPMWFEDDEAPEKQR